jgi:hypothetical protein
LDTSTVFVPPSKFDFKGQSFMPNIKEIVDSKEKLISSDASNPGFPSVEKMRESQRKGSEGTGTQPSAASDEDESTGDSFPAYLGGRA